MYPHSGLVVHLLSLVTSEMLGPIDLQLSVNCNRCISSRTWVTISRVNLVLNALWRPSTRNDSHFIMSVCILTSLCVSVNTR